MDHRSECVRREAVLHGERALASHVASTVPQAVTAHNCAAWGGDELDQPRGPSARNGRRQTCTASPCHARASGSASPTCTSSGSVSGKRLSEFTTDRTAAQDRECSQLSLQRTDRLAGEVRNVLPPESGGMAGEEPVAITIRLAVSVRPSTTGVSGEHCHSPLSACKCDLGLTVAS